MNWLIKLVALGMMYPIMSCSSDLSFSGSKTNRTHDKKQTPQASLEHVQDDSVNSLSSDSQRPHEEGEGLPGFLVDPNNIMANRSGEEVEFSAPSGTVRQGNGLQGKVSMNIFIFSRNSAVASSGADGSIEILTTGTPFYSDPDGSFKVTINLKEDEKALITTAEQSRVFKVQSESKVEAVVWKDGETSILDERSMTQLAADTPFDLDQLVNQSSCIDCNFVGIDFLQQRAERKNLEGSDFSESNLSQSNFAEGQMADTRFVNAKLIGVNFAKADLRNADFTGADTTGCNFAGADLSGAVGLTYP